MKELNSGKQMKDTWVTPTVGRKEKQCGKFPTQKPISILEKILLASTKKEDVVLDIFNGSGTTGIACKRLNRKYIGIDINRDYLDLTIKRYNNEK